MKKTRIIKIKPTPIIWVNERHDTDRDGVPNYADCNPWNPHQQGWLHDKLADRKAKRQEKQYMEQEREGKETYVGVAKQHKQQEKEIQRQVDRASKPVYIYVKTGDPRLKGGLRWHFVGAYDRKYLPKIVRELSGRDDIYGIESSDRSDMEGYLNKRDFKEATKTYVSERKWKENVRQGLKTKEQQEKERRLREYQKMMELERRVTGAPQVMVHSGSEMLHVLGKPQRKVVYRSLIK